MKSLRFAGEILLAWVLVIFIAAWNGFPASDRLTLGVTLGLAIALVAAGKMKRAT